MVTPACNPTYPENRRIEHGQKVSKTPPQPISWIWWYTSAIQSIREDQGLGQPRQKIIKAKRDGSNDRAPVLQVQGPEFEL
jgi:hypothetical protein